MSDDDIQTKGPPFFFTARADPETGFASEDRPDGTYIVRLYDMFDGWIDVSGPLPRDEAKALWDEKTNNGTRNVKYGDGDYYAIYAADTRMVHTPEFRGR